MAVALSDILENYYNREGGQKADSMAGLVTPLYESITNTAEKYESLKGSIESSWNTGNNQTTLEAVDLVKGAVDEVGNATETLQQALNNAVSLNGLIVEIKGLVEEYNSMEKKTPVYDGNNKVTGYDYSAEQKTRRAEIEKDVEDKNKEGEQDYNNIKNTLSSISLARIENAGKSGGMFSEFIEKRRKFLSSDIDIDDLLAFCSQYQKSDYLKNYFTWDQVAQYLAGLTEGHSSRETAVLSAVGIIKLCAENGFGIKYNYGSKDIMTQIDCSGFVSWAVAQAVPGFQKRGSSGFQAKSLGANYITYAEMQGGDVLCVPGEHVMMVVQNDPLNQTVIVAEAGSPVKLRKRTYHELKWSSAGTYNAIDMTNVYERADAAARV